MTTRTELHIPRSSWTINHDSKAILMGSCFADNMGEKLLYHGFNVKVNPFGTTFNPISLAHIIDLLCGHKSIDIDKFVMSQGLWYHYDFHSKMVAKTKEGLLEKLSLLLEDISDFIKKADFLFLTLGTSIAYTINEKSWVNNCHKQASHLFSKKDISLEVGAQCLTQSIHRLLKINPTLKIVFTLSPVRHIKDGIQENARSKARCLLIIDSIKNSLDANCAYFPAYEWMIDDLRDYRYYSDDMIHPSNKAISFLWDRFVDHLMEAETKDTCQEVAKIRSGLDHRPFNPDSDAHRLFLKNMAKNQADLIKRYPHITW